MKNLSRSKILCVVSPIILGLLAPSILLFLVQVIVGGWSIRRSLSDVMAAQFASGRNLWLVAAFGLIPFALLSAFLLFYVRNHSLRASYCLCVGGLLGIFALMIPGHISVWYPLYAGEHMSSTAVIAFFFIPIYCVVTMIVGLLVGWLVSRARWFQDKGASSIG